MRSLRELQQRFCDAIVQADGRDVAHDAVEPGAQERLAIYRRTIRANYRNALAATYPVVRQLCGWSLFDAAVDAFVLAHPSGAGDLNVYGDAFGDFLEAYAPARERPHLADLARLEWAIDESSRAADSTRAPEAVLGALSAIEPERLPGVRMRLDPSCRLVESRFPILSIWKQRALHEDTVSAAEAGPDHIVVRREPEGVLLEPAARGRYAWLAALAEGATLSVAIDRALAADATFDLGTALCACIGDGTIAAIETDS